MEPTGRQRTWATNDRLITLRVWKSDKADVEFTFNVLLDNRMLTSNLNFTTEQSRLLRKLSDEYAQLFTPERPLRLTPGALSDIGVQLFEVWLAVHWPILSTSLRPDEPRELVIVVTHPIGSSITLGTVEASTT